LKLKQADSFESLRNTIAAFVGSLLWSTTADQWTTAERETVFRLSDMLLEEIENTLFGQKEPEQRMDA